MTRSADFRFYGDLNDFLPPEQQQIRFPYPFNGQQSVKHLIEAAGIPHPEVDLILANDEPTSFDYLVEAGDMIAVYPQFHNLDLTGITPLRPPLAFPPTFVLDNHLGRLARYLRLLGFDTAYPREHLDDSELAQIAHDENRVMLTRDKGLLMRSLVIHGYCLRTTDSEAQLAAVMTRFNLQTAVQPWRRCLRCNGLLQAVAKSEIEHRLEPKTKQYFNEFRICRNCKRIYWRGSHFQKLEQFVNQYLPSP